MLQSECKEFLLLLIIVRLDLAMQLSEEANRGVGVIDSLMHLIEKFTIGGDSN